jgi:hypothetical protein
MRDQDPLRGRVARLLTMANEAREQGHLDYAERFTQRAAEILEPSTALERLGTQSGKRVAEHPERYRPRSHPRATKRTGRASSRHRKAG